MNTIVLPLLIAGSLFKIISDGQRDLVFVFVISVAVLVFFSLLLRFVLHKKSTANTELRARTLTFWWMLAFFQVSVASHPLVFSLLLTLFSMLAFYEYTKFDSTTSSRLTMPLNVLCFTLISVSFYLVYNAQEPRALLICILFLLLVIPVMLVFENAKSGQVQRLGHLTSGVVFFAVALPMAVSLFRISEIVLLLCVFMTEMRDMSAYWIGKQVQKLSNTQPHSRLIHALNHPVASNINGTKSWGVGLISLLLLVVLALSFSGLINRTLGYSVSPWLLALWALVIGVLGLMGDLTFSMLKRDFNIKDSGSMMPGNTGIIDRVDALILTVPATYLLFNYVLEEAAWR